MHPLDVLPYLRLVFICLIQGSSQVFELCHPLINVITSLLYKMNSIYSNLSAIYTSLCHKRIDVALSYLHFLLCLHSHNTILCIPQWLHNRRGISNSCRIAISPLPMLCALSGHLSTGHTTDLNTCGKDTAYLSGPPLPTTTLLVYGMTI